MKKELEKDWKDYISNLLNINGTRTEIEVASKRSPRRFITQD
jgi:hypothetical protein